MPDIAATGTAIDPRPLVIVDHPDLAGSRVDARLAAELRRHPDEFVVRDLYGLYPTGSIDVEAEQGLLRAHDLIVYQFPIWWYTCPPLLHHWMNEVFSEGWAYGGEQAGAGEPGRMLAGKRFACAVAAGDIEGNYQPDGSVGASVAQVLEPFHATARYLGATAVEPDFATFGTEVDLTDERLERVAADYVAWLRGIA